VLVIIVTPRAGSGNDHPPVYEELGRAITFPVGCMGTWLAEDTAPDQSSSRFARYLLVVKVSAVNADETASSSSYLSYLDEDGITGGSEWFPLVGL